MRTRNHSDNNSYTSRKILWILFMLPVSLMSRTVLFLMGWSAIDDIVFNKLTMNKRCVLVFSHTSYSDFYILLLYLLSYPNRSHYIRTLVKPQPFEYAGWLLNKIGAIPATRVDFKNGGSVPKIVSEIIKCPECLFLISPKGTIVKAEWRSGYYNIAKQLNCNILVTGLDYEIKKPKASYPIYHGENEEDIKPFLLQELSDIVPLYPECEIVPIRCHDSNKRNILNMFRFISCLSISCLCFYLTSLSSFNNFIILIFITNLLFKFSA